MAHAGRHRKRRASSSVEPASKASRDTKSQSIPPNTPEPSAKRLKRAVASPDQQLTDELQYNVEHTRDDTVNVVIDSAVDAESIDVAPQRSRITKSKRHTDTDLLAVDESTPTLTATSQQTTKKFKIRSRSSLPGNVNSSLNTNSISNVQFAPLRDVLDSRTRRRLRRSHLSEEVNEIVNEEHQKDRQLRKAKEVIARMKERENEMSLELETQRQFAIQVDSDDAHEKVKETEAELQQLRQQLAAREASAAPSQYINDEDIPMADDGIASDDDDDVPFIEPEDINITHEDMTASQEDLQISQTFASSFNASQVTVADPTHEADVQSYEAALLTAKTVNARLETSLQMLTIELHSLGFAQEGDVITIITSSLREAFRQFRVDLENLLPGRTSPEVTDRDLLHATVVHIKDLLEDIREKTEILRQCKEVESAVRAQNKGLIEKLSELDEKHTTLEERWHTLDHANEDSIRTITTLKELVGTLQDNLEDRDVLISRKDHEFEELATESQNQVTSIERLQNALNSVTEDLSRTEQIVTQMENDHAAAISQLQSDHAEVVLKLEAELNDERENLIAADEELQNSAQYTTALEERVGSMENDLDGLRDRLKNLESLIEKERSTREAVENTLIQKMEDTNKLEVTIEKAEQTVDELRSEIKQLHANIESERHQRELAEEANDEAKVRIDDLEKRIHSTGIQANELRQKMFEMQVKKEGEITKLQSAAAERETEFADQLAKEGELQEALESSVKERDDTIAALETQIAEMEQEISSLAAEKEEVVKKRSEKVKSLNNELKTIQDNHDAHRRTTAAQINALEDKVAELKHAVDQRDTEVQNLQSRIIELEDVHKQGITERDERINGLEFELDDTHSKINALEEENASLERRVEDEANQMLEYQVKNSDTIDAQNKRIEVMDASIKSLSDSLGRERDAYALLESQKQREVEELTTIATQRATVIEKQAATIAELKERFRAQVRKGKNALMEQDALIKEAFKRTEMSNQVFVDESNENLEAVEALEELGPTVEVVKVEKVKKGRRRLNEPAYRDSGIGADVDDDEE